MTQPPDSPGEPGPQQPQWGPPPSGWPPPQPPQPQQPGQWPQPEQPGQWQPPQEPGYWQPPQQPGQWQPPQQQGPWMPPPQGPWDQLGPPVTGPRPKSRVRTPLLAAIVTAAVIGGGTATYLAVSDTRSGYQGAATPRAAITSLVADLNKSDLLGILDHLPPGERASLLGPIKESIDQAKRLHVLKTTADASNVAGVDVNAQNLTFGQGEETINDHVKVVQLTGGTITINADLRQVPLTDEYVKLVFPNGLPSNSSTHQKIDIADRIANANDGKPIRLAAQKINGKWYPSLLYTIADNIANDGGAGNPGPGDYVAPRGAGSAEDAVKQAVIASSQNDFRRLIELASPDEDAVVHDYGGLILKNTTASADSTFTVKDLQLTSKQLGDATRVSLKSITVAVPDHETTVAVNGTCLEITVDGDYRNFCANQIVTLLNSGPFTGKPLTSEETAALTRFAEGIPNIGIDVTQSGGQWYISPLRTYFDMSNAVLEPLHDTDLFVLIKLFMNR